MQLFSKEKYSSPVSEMWDRILSVVVLASDKMNKILTTSMVGMFLVGCATNSNYKSSADNLLRTEYPKPYYGVTKSWKPLGKNHEYNLSDIESNQSSLDSDFCINDLSSKYPFRSSEALRVLQIIDCMEAKGWHLEMEEILIMR